MVYYMFTYERYHFSYAKAATHSIHSIYSRLHCSALGVDGNYEVDNILKIESRKT